jgi:predicted nuclease with TOPRIM domain
MSSDRLTEILNFLSAMSRDVGELRQEIKQSIGELRQETKQSIGELRQELHQFREETNERFKNIEREIRRMSQRLDRIESVMLANRADIAELQDRVVALEEKPA